MCDVKATLRRTGVVLLTTVLLAVPGLVAWADPPEAWEPEDPRIYKDLVAAARAYFDLDEELWKGRKLFLEQLEQCAKAGTFHLKDMDALRWLVNQSRYFEPDMRDRKWQRKQGIEEAKSLADTLYWIKSHELQITFSLPRTYPGRKSLREKFPRVPPYPLLLALHEEEDSTGKPYPGRAMVERLYSKEAWQAIAEDWLVLIPEAAAGNYLDKDRLVRPAVFKRPFARFWRHYHVDFDRVVLQGAEQAFAVAASLPVFFAGIVFRGDWALQTDEQRKEVRNFAPVPVYVVDNVLLADQLKAAGHTRVTAGGEEGLLQWMKKRRRVAPRQFEWSAQRFDQLLPYWINLDSLNWEAPERTLSVALLDTPDHPNTVCLEGRGIQNISLFLDDDLVDLDRPVRVVLNGDLVHDRLIEVSERMARHGLTRDVDLMFNTEPVRIRNSLFYGWLKTARIVRLNLRDPTKSSGCMPEAAPAVETPEVPAKPVEGAEKPAEDTGAGPLMPPSPVPRAPEPPEEEETGLPVGIVIALLFLLLLVLLLLLRRRR